MRSQIIQLLTEALRDMGVRDVVPTLTRPEDLAHGNYATNVAMVVAKQLKKSPMEIAKIIQEAIIKYQKASSEQIFAKVEIAPPGFINLFLSEANLINQLDQVLTEGETFGVSRQPQDLRKKSASREANKQRVYPEPRRVMIEFSDANPFKEFHIGHLRNISLGESFSRLLEADGNEVRRVSYQGDVGMHVAKALYGIKTVHLDLEVQQDKTPKEKAELLGKAYVAGSKAFEDPSTDGQEAKKEIIEINKSVYHKDPSITLLWKEGRQWSLDYFDTVYERVGTDFTRFYFESEVAPLGVSLVTSHMKDAAPADQAQHEPSTNSSEKANAKLRRGVFEESEGAIIFRGENVGLHTRVFVSREGYATYEAKDLALAPLKYSEYPYDLSIIMTGNEQSAYFTVMLAALARIHPDLAKKTRHVPFGMVRLTTGKMASRAGNVITADWLINEAKDRIYHILQKNESKYDKKTQDKIAEKAAIAAVKYSMLKVTASSDIAFDLEKSVSFEGDSGPYLQYTYARCKSVLRKAPEQPKSIQGLALNSEERKVVRLIGYFPEIVEEAAKHLSPNTLCTYLFQLAQAFNLFYAKHEILGSDPRLTLTQATATVLKNGLFLLGIDVLEHM